MNLNLSTFRREKIGLTRRRGMLAAYRFLVALTVITVFTVVEAEATHYRNGNVSWNRVNNASRTVTFTATSAWRRSFYSPSPNVGSVVSVGIFNYGDGGNAPMNITVTAVGLPITNYTFMPGLPVTANPVSSVFSITLSFVQLRNSVITFTGTRNGGTQTSTTVIINVNTNPVFISPTPTERTTYMIPTGVLHEDHIAATNPDPSVHTQISSALIPAGATVFPPVPTASDAIASTTLFWTPSASDFGSHTLTFEALYANGRSTTRSYILWPNTLPSFTSAPVATAKECALYSYTITAGNIDNGSCDNCGIASMTVSPATFTCADAGSQTVTLTVTDNSSHTSICSTVVTVQYLPTCSITAVPGSGAFTGGPATTIYLGYGPQVVTLSGTVSGGSGFIYSWSGLSASSTALLSCTRCSDPVFSSTSEGRYKFTLTATNSNGCSTNC